MLRVESNCVFCAENVTVLSTKLFRLVPILPIFIYLFIYLFNSIAPPHYQICLSCGFFVGGDESFSYFLSVHLSTHLFPLQVVGVETWYY